MVFGVFRFIVVDDIEGPITHIEIETVQGTLCCAISVSPGSVK